MKIFFVIDNKGRVYIGRGSAFSPPKERCVLGQWRRCSQYISSIGGVLFDASVIVECAIKVSQIEVISKNLPGVSRCKPGKC